MLFTITFLKTIVHHFLLKLAAHHCLPPACWAPMCHCVVHWTRCGRSSKRSVWDFFVTLFLILFNLCNWTGCGHCKVRQSTEIVFFCSSFFLVEVFCHSFRFFLRFVQFNRVRPFVRKVFLISSILNLNRSDGDRLSVWWFSDWILCCFDNMVQLDMNDLVWQGE